jgi:hypothetical protein
MYFGVYHKIFKIFRLYIFLINNFDTIKNVNHFALDFMHNIHVFLLLIINVCNLQFPMFVDSCSTPSNSSLDIWKWSGLQQDA